MQGEHDRRIQIRAAGSLIGRLPSNDSDVFTVVGEVDGLFQFVIGVIKLRFGRSSGCIRSAGEFERGEIQDAHAFALRLVAKA